MRMAEQKPGRNLALDVSNLTPNQRWLMFASTAVLSLVFSPLCSMLYALLIKGRLPLSSIQNGLKFYMVLVAAAALILGPLERFRASLYAWVGAAAGVTLGILMVTYSLSAGKPVPFMPIYVEGSLQAATGVSAAWILSRLIVSALGSRRKDPEHKRHTGPYEL